MVDGGEEQTLDPSKLDALAKAASWKRAASHRSTLRIRPAACLVALAVTGPGLGGRDARDERGELANQTSATE